MGRAAESDDRCDYDWSGDELMLTAAKISALVCGVTAIIGTMIAVLTYGGAVMSSEVEHESRHTKVETAVLRIEKSAEDHWQIIESQLQAGQERDLLIMQWLRE